MKVEAIKFLTNVLLFTFLDTEKCSPIGIPQSNASIHGTGKFKI